MKVPLFYVFRSEEMEYKVLEVLRSGCIATGSYIGDFSNKFSQLINQKNVVTINDVSNAVQIALHLSGVQIGDEVIATPFSCMSSNSPIALLRANVRWADVDPSTASVCVDSIRKIITKKTKAVMIYHIAGYPSQIDEIAKLCEYHGVKLIEDCNSALNATFAGKKVGSFSDFSVYSFYPNRSINAGEGGALVCRNDDLAARATKLRRYGIDLKSFRLPDGEIDASSDIPEVGWGATLNNLCSAMGSVQIDSVQFRINKGRQVAAKYFKAFIENSQFTPVIPIAFSEPSFWVFMLRTGKQGELLQYLKRNGIACSKLHQLNTVYSGFHVKDFYVPGAQQFMKEIVCIPCGWWLTDAQVDYVIERVNSFV